MKKVSKIFGLMILGMLLSIISFGQAVHYTGSYVKPSWINVTNDNVYVLQQTVDSIWNGTISFSLVTLTGDTITIGTYQKLYEVNPNKATFNNSLGVTDTLTAEVGIVTGSLASATLNTGQGANELYDMDQNVLTTSDVGFGTVSVTTSITLANDQVITESNSNNVLFSNSITATDTVIGPVVAATARFNIGTVPQVLYEENINMATFDNSLKATDTLFAAVVSSTGNISGTGITGTALPTFSIAAGTLTVSLPDDTVGVAISGLTASAIVLCSYAETVGAPDTVAQVYAVTTGWLTLMGENGKTINYWIPKK